MKTMKKKRLLIDMDGVLVDFESGIKQQTPETLALFEGCYDEIPGIFNYMTPMPKALESYRQLAEWFDVYICSTAPWNNDSAWSAKNLWVRKYLGDVAHKRLILTHHKNLVIGDYIIDDRTRHGVDIFPGTHIHFGTEKFPDWDAVMEFFEKERSFSVVCNNEMLLPGHWVGENP